MSTEASHLPVLLEEVVRFLCSADRKLPIEIMDCTLGLGGHARALLNKAGKDARLIGMDADEENVILAKQNLASFGGQIRFFHSNFSNARDVLDAIELDRVDALVADLGFCSSQIDNSQYGLSFRDEMDGPLDMRYDRSTTGTAADIVNRYNQQDLADLIYRYGEERLSRRIAQAVINARKEAKIERTSQLANIIMSAMPQSARRGTNRIHPATRTFQALRIAVNNELGSLERLLEMIPELVGRNGRAAIISFHSLEDRLVKRAFRELVETGKALSLTRKPVTATDNEIAMNPRSRSAKLRVIEMT